MAAVCPQAYIDLAERLAGTARDIVLPYFRRPLEVDRKDDDSPVTRADREAEAAMRRIIEAEFPQHGILGEEYGADRADAEFVWVLDPVDGTRASIAGLPVFGTLIALCQRGRSILGVIDCPAMNERWLGAAGRPTTFNGQTATTRPCAELGQAILYATAPDQFVGANREAFGRVEGAVRERRFGTDCYAYGLVASGFGDLVVEAQLKPHDYLAHCAVIEGAGGAVTDWAGEALTLQSNGRVVGAGDARIHEQTLRTLRAAN